MEVNDVKWFFPSGYISNAEHYYNFQSRPDDVWITTFPRSGTTWTQELVWMIANDLDYEGSRKSPLIERFPFFEFSMFLHEDVKEELLELNEGFPEQQELVEKMSVPVYETLANISSRRFIKTHFPFSLLPPSVMEQGSKIVYVARNPRDVAVSFYHLNRLFASQGYIGDFTEYWEYFENDLAPWCPYWEHIKEGWEYRNHPNVLFMFYEDMNKDLPGTIRKVADFLGKSFTEEQIEKLSDHLHIRNFKNNPSVNCEELKRIKLLNSAEQSFVRSGKSDGWSEEYTPELKEKVLKWIENNSKDLKFQFPVRY